MGRNAQLAKQHAPAAKMDATAKGGERLGGTMGGSWGAKPAGKEKSSGQLSNLAFYQPQVDNPNNLFIIFNFAITK